MRPTPVWIAATLALALGAATVYVYLTPSPKDPDASADDHVGLVQPPANCGPAVPAQIHRSENTTLYRLAPKEGVEHRTEDITYVVELPEGRTSRGTLSAAWGAPPDAVQFEDAAPQGVVSEGDRLVVPDGGALNLNLYDAAGYDVGGTWACL